MPALFTAATLTVYVTPSVKLANKRFGVLASIVTFVSTRDLFRLMSIPRTIMLYDIRTPAEKRRETGGVMLNKMMEFHQIMQINNSVKGFSLLRDLYFI